MHQSVGNHAKTRRNVIATPMTGSISHFGVIVAHHGHSLARTRGNGTGETKNDPQIGNGRILFIDHRASNGNCRSELQCIVGWYFLDSILLIVGPAQEFRDVPIPEHLNTVAPGLAHVRGIKNRACTLSVGDKCICDWNGRSAS